jgi:hypothetical protein
MARTQTVIRGTKHLDQAKARRSEGSRAGFCTTDEVPREGTYASLTVLQTRFFKGFAYVDTSAGKGLASHPRTLSCASCETNEAETD